MRSLLAIAIILAGCVVWLATVSDRSIEANSMTGAYRTKMRYAFVIDTGRKIQSTWVADSAKRLGIDTESGWEHLSTISMRGPFRSNACSVGHRVASGFRYVGSGDLAFESPSAADEFVRDFVTAEEAERKVMLESRLSY